MVVEHDPSPGIGVYNARVKVVEVTLWSEEVEVEVQTVV